MRSCFCALLTVLIVSDGLEQPILSGQKALYGTNDDADQSKQLSDEWRSYQNDKAQVAFTLLRRESVPGETTQWRPPFVSNDSGAYWLSRLAYEQLVARCRSKRSRAARTLSNAKMDVERYQKAIEFSQKRLAEAGSAAGRSHHQQRAIDNLPSLTRPLSSNSCRRTRTISRWRSSG